MFIPYGVVVSHQISVFSFFGLIIAELGTNK